MFPNMPGTFSLSKMIGGLSRTLSVANQLIPLYQQATPMIKNARNAFNLLKDMNLGSLFSKNNLINNNNNHNEKVIHNPSNYNNPSFFQ